MSSLIALAARQLVSPLQASLPSSVSPLVPSASKPCIALPLPMSLTSPSPAYVASPCVTSPHLTSCPLRRQALRCLRRLALPPVTSVGKLVYEIVSASKSSSVHKRAPKQARSRATHMVDFCFFSFTVNRVKFFIRMSAANLPAENHSKSLCIALKLFARMPTNHILTVDTVRWLLPLPLILRVERRNHGQEQPMSNSN